MGSLLTTLAAALLHIYRLPALLPQPIIGWGLFLFLGVISLIELPIMIFGLRKMGDSAEPNARRATLFGNAAFVFFPAIYALPNLLLTDISQLWMGLLIAGLSLGRFAASMLFLPAHPN